MTSAQIRFKETEEAKRHNLEQEENWRQQNAEIQRANLESERLKAEANAVNQYIAELQAETSRYVSDQNVEASRYNADTHLIGTTYSASTNAETSRYITDTQVAQNRYATDRNYEIGAQQNRLRAQEVELKRQDQMFTQNQAAQKLKLEKLYNQAQIARTEAETNRLRSEVDKINQQLTIDWKNYMLRAQEQGNANERTKAQVALQQAQTFEATARGAETLTRWVQSLISSINSFVGG